MNETVLEQHGVEMLVKYEFYKGETQTYDHPGEGPRVEVYEIIVGDQDIFSIVTGIIIEDIENEILNQIINQ